MEPVEAILGYVVERVQLTFSSMISNCTSDKDEQTMVWSIFHFFTVILRKLKFQWDIL